MNDNEVAISRKQISGEVPMVANVITDSCVYTGLFGSLGVIVKCGVWPTQAASCF